MREILFRGKRVDNGEWIYGVPITDKATGDAYIITSTAGAYLRSEINNMCATGFRAIPETVGRYTGLTDKNGTRIFEGDIIKQVIPHNLVQPFIFTVNWCEECAMFVLPCITNDAFESDFTVMRSDEIEVIGNIHDNPELLKGE